MSRKGPEVGQGILDFEEDCCIGVKSNLLALWFEMRKKWSQSCSVGTLLQYQVA